MTTIPLARLVLGEPMNLWQGLGLVVAFLGVVVIYVHGRLAVLLGLRIGLGDLVALGGVALFAGYTVLLKRAKFELLTLPLLVILLAAGSLAALSFSLWEVWHGEHQQLAATGYLALLYRCVVGGTLMYFLYIWSVGVLGAGRAGTMVYTQVIFSTFFAWASASPGITRSAPAFGDAAAPTAAGARLRLRPFMPHRQGSQAPAASLMTLDEIRTIGAASV